MDSQLVFDALVDPTRRRILALLDTRGELCVCELTEALAQGQPKISRHLATLKEAGLVVPRRAGTWMHYRLETDLPSWLPPLLAGLRDGAVADLEADQARLDAMNKRPERCAA